MDEFVSNDFIVSMGSILLVGEAIHKLININKKTEKDDRNSLWEIAKFTVSSFVFGKKQKRNNKKVH